MRLRRLGQLGCALLTVVLWLFARPVLAADPFGVVTVDLRPQAGEVPTHICVVSQDEGPRTRNTLADFLEKEALADATLPVLPKAWEANSASASCTGEGGVSCLPRVQLPQGSDTAGDLYAACTSDSLLSLERAQHPRLLVLLLEHLEGSPPAIESLNLTGGVATIGVKANLRRIVVTARSLGGHYTPHERAYRAERSGLDNTLIVLPLTPRCRSIDLVLPGARIRADDRKRMTLEAYGAQLDVDSCVGALRGSSKMSVQLPRAPEEGGSLQVRIEPREGQRPAATQFGGRWDGAWPQRRFELAAEQVGFEWQKPLCVYSETQCPQAELEGGIECTPTVLEGACHYTCPGTVDDVQIVEVEFPIAVTFKKDSPRQTWTDILQRPGQSLSSYVPGDQTYLTAETGDWETDIPGSRVEAFEILGNDGSVRRYGVGGAKTLDVHVPGATCEPVRYKLVGDRHYKEGVAQIEDGKLVFGDALKTARLMSFNIVINQGGGPALISGAPPNVQEEREVYFIVLAQLAANFRPRNPKYARLAGELRLGGTIGQWGFYGPESVGDSARRVREKIAWARFLVEPALVVDVAHPLAMSFGFGVGSSWPIQGSNVPTTDRFAPILAPSMDLRFQVRRWLSFVLQARAIFLERTSIIELQGDGSLERMMRPTTTLYGMYGVQLTF